MIKNSSAALLLLLLAACAGGGGVDRAREKKAWETFKKGIRAAQKRDHKTAVELFTEAIRLAPDFHQAYDYRASSMEELGKFDEALADFSRAIETAPEEHKDVYYFNRARFLQRRNRNEEAERDFTAAIERQKEWADPAYMLHFHLGRALFYLETGRPDDCVADCNYVLSLKPDEETRAAALKLISEAEAPRDRRPFHH